MRMKLSEFCEINPRITLKKGELAKKIAMTDLPTFGKTITSYTIEEYKGGTKFQNGDTLMARITPCLENGKGGYVDILDDSEVAFGSTEYIVFREKLGISDSQFLYYFINTSEFREIAIKSMTGTSGRQRVQTDLIANMEFEFPELEEQRKIAQILCYLDDKIKINNQLNANLYAQAQSLFEQSIEAAGDGIIKKTIGEIADVKGGKRLPKGVSLKIEPNTHPYIRIRDLNDSCIVQLTDAFEYVDDETQKGIARYIVSARDVLISIVGTIGLSAMVHSSLDNANLTENCVKLTNLQGVSPEYLLLFIKSKAGQNAIAQCTVGAVQPKLPIKNIQAISIPIVGGIEMEELNEMIHYFFDMISKILTENSRLAQLRNALLPKLMSGELDVSDLEI